VTEFGERMLRAGLGESFYHATVTLAAAEVMAEELAAQTGGERPTLRATLYRMMGKHKFGKGIYRTLSTVSANVRLGGVWARDFFAETDPLQVYAPNDWEAAEALASLFGGTLSRPRDAFTGTPLVVGVLVEAAGSRAAIEGALRQRLGFPIPVFASAGMPRVPRMYAVEQRMQRWARVEEDNERAPLLFTLTDHDPTGLVIGRQFSEQIRGVEVVRLGMSPVLADAHKAPGSEGIVVPDEEQKSHEKTDLWRDAKEADEDPDTGEARDRRFQAEALDYATWAQIIGDALEERLIAHNLSAVELRDTLNTRGDTEEFRTARMIAERFGEVADSEKGIQVLAWIAEQVEDGDPQTLADALGLELDEE
jgi:hypothetical protein